MYKKIIYLLLALCIFKNAHGKQYEIDDYEKLSIYLLTEEVIDTLVVFLPDSFKLNNFLKMNPKKDEILKLTIYNVYNKTISDEFSGYNKLVSLRLYGNYSEIDVIPFFLTIPNVDVLIVKCAKLKSDFLFECAKLKHLVYLSIRGLEEMALPPTGFEKLRFFYVRGSYTSICSNIINYPELAYMTFSNNIRDVDTNILDHFYSKGYGELSIWGVNIPENVMSVAKEKYTPNRIVIFSSDPNNQNHKTKKIRFKKIRFFFAKANYKVRKFFTPCDCG